MYSSSKITLENYFECGTIINGIVCNYQSTRYSYKRIEGPVIGLMFGCATNYFKVVSYQVLAVGSLVGCLVGLPVSWLIALLGCLSVG